ncbi:MAG: pyridoxamine 5'-phosphate oxidase family protein [Ilumatobacteraceae bacterium]|jgi:hypothetical protein
MSWRHLSSDVPEFASLVHERFVAHRHHVLATLASDGRPRQWGTEVGVHDGELWIGMPADSTKCRDLHRDPRCSLHCAPIDVEMVEGDAVIEARARLLDGQASLAWLAQAIGAAAPEGAVVALLEPSRVRLVTVDGDELLTRVWSGSGVVEHRRR